MVIGGWQDSDKQGRSLKSLLLGYCDRAGRLVFAGKAWDRVRSVGDDEGRRYGVRQLPRLRSCNGRGDRTRR